MITKDKLWKAIFEDFFREAIAFFFPKFYLLIDWSKGYEMLDKELNEISSESDEPDRRADLLVKVWLLDGTEQWILIHIEVQGYKDPHFARRMFTYYYRITERFNKPVSALAVLTDPNKQWLPDRYKARCMETVIIYKYKLYKLAKFKEKDFENNSNPWAIVMKTALLGLKAKWTDAALLQMKVKLYRELRTQGYAAEKVKLLMHFIKYYVHFREKDFFSKFDQEIKIIENKSDQPMGVVELVKQHLIEAAKMEGIEQGIEQGIVKGLNEGEIRKSIIGIRNMLKKGFDPVVIAELLEVEHGFVLDIQQQLEKESEIISMLKSGHLEMSEIAAALQVHPLLVKVIAGGWKS